MFLAYDYYTEALTSYSYPRKKRRFLVISCYSCYNVFWEDKTRNL